jgi:FkbM family methyltransferase
LRRNVSLNQLTWAHVNEAAVADVSGVAPFVPPDDAGEFVTALPHCQGVGFLGTGYSPGIQVNTLVLDDYAEQNSIDQLSLIKLDIEGGEFRALVGAERVIQRFRPVIAVEYNRAAQRRSSGSIHDLDDLLDSLGYERFLFSDRFVKLDLNMVKDVPDQEAVFNVYCFPREH